MAKDRGYTRYSALAGGQVTARVVAPSYKSKLASITYGQTVRTAQLTLSVSVIQTSHLMPYREIIAVCSQIHTKDISTLCGQNGDLLNGKLAVHIATTGL